MLSAVLIAPFTGNLVSPSSSTIDVSEPPMRLHVAPLSRSPRIVFCIMVTSAYGLLSPKDVLNTTVDTSRKCLVWFREGIR